MRFDPQNLDAGLLMWDLQRSLAVDRLPARRVIVRFDFRGFPRGYRRSQVFWLVLDRPQVELCVTDPGVEVDLYVDADFKAFARVWLGDTPFTAAAQAGDVTLKGPRELVRAFPSWLRLSAFAQIERPADVAVAR